MSRWKVRWAVPVLAVLVPFAVIGLPALAQQAGKPPAGELNRAREMAALIGQGQMSLRDATTLAEKHCKGTALEAKCTIEGAEPKPTPTAPPSEPEGPKGAVPPRESPSAPKESLAGNRLVYEVSCFVKDKLETLHVDGLTKKVLEPASPK